MSAPDSDLPYVICAADQPAGAASLLPHSDCDCDCACATLPISTLCLEASQLAADTRYVADFATLPLDEQHIVAYNPRYGIAVLSRAAQTLAAQFAHPQSPAAAQAALPEAWSNNMAERVLTRLAMLGLLRPVDAPLPPIADTPAALTAWLHLTDRCNLRCTYCYLPHLPLDMTPEVGHEAIDATIRSALAQSFRAIKLKYAGGEALLRLSLIAELHTYAIEQSAHHHLALDGVVLSNGTLLTDTTIRMLHALGLRLMISLDGLGAAHDSQRPYAGGQGSFADVDRAVGSALVTGLIPDISITVTGASVAGLPDLIAWVLARDLPFSLNFYRENERSASHAELQLAEQEIIDGILAAYHVIEANLPRRSLLGSLIDKASLAAPHAHPCSAGRGYLVFDHKGQVSSCQMQISRPVASVAAPDALWLIQDDASSLQNLHVDAKEGCRDCDWKYWCAGGCPVATHRATGRYDLRSPNCAIYKALFPAAVRLEGLRLLTYFGP